MPFSLLDIGVKEDMSRTEIRKYRLTNFVLTVLFVLGLILLIPSLYENGFIVSAYMNLASVALMAVLLFINHFGYINFTRLVASIYPSVIIVSASIVVKTVYPQSVVIFDFFDARVLAGGFFVLPYLFFGYREKKYLFASLSSTVLLVLAFDPLHNLFGVGYTNFFGPMSKAYIVSGIYIDIVLFFASWAFYYFKSNIEGLLQKNALLVEDLEVRNVELSALFEELESSHQMLKKNGVLINEQKQLLERTNEELAQQVEQKTAELQQSNEELIKHNNELQQFSNTLSHNLRGPVANLLGLAQLFKMDSGQEDQDVIAGHILKSAESLDGIIKDLNKVVELRNNLFQIKEKIEIQKTVEEVWFVLDQNVKQCNGKLMLNIDVPVFYGVRPYFQSIIYNLISNAIKYRHIDRDCLIRISSANKDNKCIIEVQDNGIGIDLDRYGEKIFGMYKRFHDHMEGKGLGLFLTKQQVEAMNGRIHVESKLGIGTRFSIELPSIPLSQIESQLFYKSDVADIYLDAVNSITTLLWKKMPQPFEFKELFRNNVEVFSTYHSDLWIVDLNLMVGRSPLEKQWIIDEAIDQYVNVGIKKAAVIRTLIDEDILFWDEFFETTKKKKIEVVFADSTSDAKEKLLNV